MRLGLALFAFVALFGVASVQADETVSGTKFNSCRSYTMCAAQTATGDCTALPASGDERVVRTFGHSQMTLYGMQSVGAYVCDVMSNDQGHDAASGVGFQVNTASLTDVSPILSINGMFDYIWITCPTIGTSATVTMLLCQSSR